MKTFIIAESALIESQVSDMMQEIGASEWWLNQDKNPNAGERLIEICGRICYKSFGTELNKNLTRVREGNLEYIGQSILKTRHGSVIEHPSTTVAFIDVSRILTHELVRHRAGVAISQESQRFVRLDSFNIYIPDLDDPFRRLVEHLEPGLDEEAVKSNIAYLTEEYMEAITEIKDTSTKWMKKITARLDHPGIPFDIKKQITSALRRFIPGGVNTNIIVTANHRAWRHMIAMRTAAGAEIEIREAFYDVARKFYHRYPALYQDMIHDNAELSECCFVNDKV